VKNPTTVATGTRPATDCQHEAFLFPDLFARKVVADFSGGTLSSDGGALLLRQIDASLGLTRTSAGCFSNKATLARKLPHDPAKVEACLLIRGVRCLPKHAKEIVLDLDSMGHLLHGLQEGRHYNDYYGDYCYLPLYIVAGDVVLWAQLRTSD